MQQYAGIYLLQNYSTCFGCPSHPSSGVHKTVTAASGTGVVRLWRFDKTWRFSSVYWLTFPTTAIKSPTGNRYRTERDTYRSAGVERNEVSSDEVISIRKAKKVIRDAYINRIQQDAAVLRYLFTAKSLYMFRVSIAPIVRSTSNCNCSLWYRS